MPCNCGNCDECMSGYVHHSGDAATIRRLESQLSASEQARAAENERLDATEKALGNLLAVIHRDGGHYQSDHGTKKAAEDAEAIVLSERAAREKAEALHEQHCGLEYCPAKPYLTEPQKGKSE